MNLDEARERFIQSWGALGSNWGINRTMAQIHALLLISSEALSAEEVMAGLDISRGNANMNLRALIDWGLVRKVHKSGERKEFFIAEKDIWHVAMQVIIERRKREIAPVLQMLSEVKKVKGDSDDPEVKAFIDSVDSLDTIVGQADSFLELLVKADQNWFANTLLKLFTKEKLNS
jgi:DNA-binding transcriptional regulator GbsR (MarR family)